MYRQTLVINAQLYGWRLLHAVEQQFGVPADQSYEAALQQMPQRPLKNAH
jgi:hypothetical protein